MSKLEFTGERFVPHKSPKKLESEHRSRYAFALEYIADRRVLDIGCGEGYGSYMMIGSAKSVVGVDIDEEAIEHAKEMYESTNLDYQVADVTKLPFADCEFDAAVCFEVIEHIENPEAVMSEAARVLKPDGAFIVSTPNGAVRTSSRPNPYHVKEFNIHELEQLVVAAFPTDKWTLSIFGQFQRYKNYTKAGVMFKNAYLTIKGALGIGPGDSDHSSTGGGLEFDFHTDKADLAEYLVAVVRGR